MTRKMEVTYCGLPEEENIRDRIVKYFAEIGATSIQTYVFWNKVEKDPGIFDWSVYEKDVEVITRYNLRWVPFIILGPWYVTPEWFRQSPDNLYARCVEHNRDSKNQSIWNEKLKPYIKRFMTEFSKHYPPNVLESVLLGISGDYGEAIYPVIGNWPGEYHGHQGYWCNDPIAIKDMQEYFRLKYNNDIESLNYFWKASYKGFFEIKPFLKENAPSIRAWLEFIEWYRLRMNQWARWWLETAKEIFQPTEIYLCTGGDGTPPHGSDFSLQCKLTAELGCGVRITNESSNYISNFVITRLVASASRYYGSFFGYEPAAIVTPEGLVARIYNARTAGAKQIHEYTGNIFEGEEATLKSKVDEKLKTHINFLQEDTPKIEVGVFIPSTYLTIREEGYSQILREGIRILRDLVDIDFLDENMINDKALKNYRILFVFEGNVARKETIENIRSWVYEGGILVSSQILKDIDGEDRLFRELVGISDKSEEIIGITNMEIINKKLLSSLSELRNPIVTRGYLNLEPSVNILACMEYRTKGAVIWSKQWGKGYSIFYSGPMDVGTTLWDDWMKQGIVVYFLKDILKNIQSLGPTVRPLFLPDGEVDGVYISTMSHEMLILNTNREPIKKAVLGREITINPYEILSIRMREGAS